MKQIIGVVFLIVSTVLTVTLLYSIGMTVIGHPGYWGVSLGVGMSTTVAWMITNLLLKKR